MDSTVSDSDVARLSDQREGQNVIVDNGILVIEELKPPDKPQERALRDYVDKSTRSIQPATGDQVVYRLKETRGAAPSGADVSPQVAVLGSSQVPVGLSSALGYLQLGQRARVKVPADLMEQAVDDTDAALHSLPTSPHQPHTPETSSQTQTPHPTPAPVAAAGAKPQARAGHWQAPAPAEEYTATPVGSSGTTPAAAAGILVSSGVVRNVQGLNGSGGVSPPSLPAPVSEQQTLRERYQPQLQQQGMVAALAARYQQQQQPAAHQQYTGAQKGALAGAPANGDVVTRADSDHSSWLPDSRASSRTTSHEAPVAGAIPTGSSRGVNQPVAGSRAVMTHRMPSVSGWTSGTSSPRSDDSAPTQQVAGDSSSTAFHTPGGSSYHSAVSTPLSVTQRQSSSGIDDNTPGPLVQGHISAGAAPGAGISAVPLRGIRSNAMNQGPMESPEHCQSPEIGASPQVNRGLPQASAIPRKVAGLNGSSVQGTRVVTAGQPVLVQQQQQQTKVGYSGPVTKSTGVKSGSKVSSAFQTPDQVLQAAARKLEIEQQQQQHQRSFDNMTTHADGAAGISNISSMVPSKRAAGPSRSAATAAAASAPQGAQVVRVSSSSSDGVASHQSGARSTAPSFKTWIPGRTGSTSESAMVSVAEEGVIPVAAAAAAGGPGVDAVSPQQHSARVSIDRKMRYSGDYASVRQSVDQEVQPSAGAGAGSSRAAAGGGGDVDAVGSSGADQDSKKEYELEVLAIIPGRGKMSGKPVLSEAAQQQEDLHIDELTRTVADSEPHFKPPKPLKGVSGWVRRHLSVNLRSPASAGKRGMKWLGIRDCFKGKDQQ